MTDLALRYLTKEPKPLPILAGLLPQASAIRASLQKSVTFLLGNRGDSKPNATNADGLPFHVFENASQWLISPTATTSEGLSIYVRGLTWAGQVAEAERVLALVEQATYFNNVPAPHWLVDLVGGTPVHAVKLGNYTSSSFTATNGVFTIPAGSPHFGQALVQPTGNLGGAQVSGIQLVCDATCTFLYGDSQGNGYDLQPIAGTGNVYSVDNYVTSPSGTVVTLDNLSVNGNVQVYYTYFDGTTLPKYGLYMSYPALLRSYDPDNGLVENRIAADAALWIADAYHDLYKATGNPAYLTKFNATMDYLVRTQTLNGAYLNIFTSAQRGLFFSAIAIYDEAGTRNAGFDLLERAYFRFAFGAATGAVNWTQGQPFTWEPTFPLEVRLKGDASGSLRWVLIDDDTSTRHYCPFIDNASQERTLTLPQAAFSTLAWAYYDPSRKPFLSLYSAKDSPSELAITQVTDYAVGFTDVVGTPFTHWAKVVYKHSGAGGFVKVGVGKPGDTGSDPTTHLELTLGSNGTQLVTVDVIDDNAVTHTLANVAVTDGTRRYVLPWSLFDNGAIAHPIQNVELAFATGAASTLYIGSILCGQREQLAATNMDLVGFETRQTSAGFIDLISVRTIRTQFDAYDGAGVALFSLESNILGDTGWRGPSYAGYQVPGPWVFYTLPDAEECLRFCRDAQVDYQQRYGFAGPFMPVFYRNLKENEEYGTIGTFWWDGPDPNTHWAGWQFRLIGAIGEAYSNIYAKTGTRNTHGQVMLDTFINWVGQYLANRGALPSDFRRDGRVETNYTSPDFWCLLARACFHKLKVDDADLAAYGLLKRCVDELLTIQVTSGAKAGAFTYPSQLVYIFHQSEVLVTLGQLLAELDELATRATQATPYQTFDLDVRDGKAQLDGGLETAVMLSLFTDARATPTDPLPVGHTHRRGWWSDRTLGSKLWTLAQEKQTDTTRNRAKQYCEQALQWLITDNVASKVEVTTQWVRQGFLSIAVAITRPNATQSRYQYLWEAQTGRAIN